MPRWDNNFDPSTGWDTGEPSWVLWGFLHTYSLTMFLGVIFSFLTVCYFWKRYKYSWEILQIMLIIIVPTSILGARLWYCISESIGGNTDVWHNFWRFSGLSIHGGVFISTACVSPYVYSKRHAVDFRTVWGIVLPSVLLGQAIGRWGNYDNHEVYGHIVSGESLDWMTFLKKGMFIDGHYRAPLFFYEFLTSMAGYYLLVWVLLRKNWVRPGVTGWLYLVWYGIVRISMEPFRDNAFIMGQDKGGAVPVSIIVAGLSIGFGLLGAIYYQLTPQQLNKLFKTTIFKAGNYELIQPIKPRRIAFFGPLVEYKGKYLWFFGEKVPNKVRLYLPIEREDKWSKREINQGYKDKKKK